ncbi:hypothetical protein Pfo_013151 [Paulownia fortunei]|nr:hypothetical protein Pfo_013151 [Paulownia fortunei]
MVQHISTCLAGIVVLALISGPVDAFSCTEALTELLPCQAFLMGNGRITISCCQGVQALRQVAAAQTDQRAICRCLKQAALSANVNPMKVKALTQFCKIYVPVPIDPNFNCNAIQNRDKNPGTKAFKHTTEGHSQGLGHTGNLKASPHTAYSQL